MPRQLCETRVEAQGRTIAEPCTSGVCGPLDVLWWRRSADAWIGGAASVAWTPEGVLRVNTLREAFAAVLGTMRSMVDDYARIAVSASCLMAMLVAEQQARPAVPTVPPTQPPPPSGWPELPGLPDIDLPDLPDLPGWPKMPEVNWLLVGLILFLGGWLSGEVVEEL